jgi:hypothetical protein
MRKLFPLLMVSILVLGGLGAVAISIEEQIKEEPLNTQSPLIEIKVKGGFLGYKVTVTNVGNASVKGHLNMTITTNAPFMPIGSQLSLPGWTFNLAVSNSANTPVRPAIGFGSANITVSGEVYLVNVGTFQYSALTTGFVFLIYISCTMPIIPIP